MTPRFQQPTSGTCLGDWRECSNPLARLPGTWARLAPAAYPARARGASRSGSWAGPGEACGLACPPVQTFPWQGTLRAQQAASCAAALGCTAQAARWHGQRCDRRAPRLLLREVCIGPPEALGPVAADLVQERRERRMAAAHKMQSTRRRGRGIRCAA